MSMLCTTAASHRKNVQYRPSHNHPSPA